MDYKVTYLDGLSYMEHDGKIFDHGAHVRDCSDKIGLQGNYIRVASRSFEENLITLEALKKVVG